MKNGKISKSQGIVKRGTLQLLFKTVYPKKVTPLYEMLADRHNDLYYHYPKRAKINLEEERNKLMEYDEEKLRWQKPYIKLSVEDFDAMVAASGPIPINLEN